jgi:hypothetical protein
LKTVPDCFIYDGERMIGFAGHYGRVHESEGSRAEIGCSDFSVLADGFGLYLFIERQPRPRGVSLLPATCVAELHRRAAVASWKVIDWPLFQSFGLAEPIARALAAENCLAPKKSRRAAILSVSPIDRSEKPWRRKS